MSCTACGGTGKTLSDSACPACGSPDVSAGIIGNEMHVHAGNVGSVAEERQISGPDFHVRVQTPVGASSDAQVADENLSMKVGGGIEMGRKGEPRVLATLLAKLDEEGVEAEDVAGAEDNRGEDSILQIQGVRRVLQIVSVPEGSEFWRAATLGSASVSASLPAAVGWLRERIMAKSKRTAAADRAHTILALDAVHAGVLAMDTIIDTYRALYGDPEEEFGLAGVWIVGPTTGTTARLGRDKNRT